MNTKALIEQYLHAHRNSWAITTKKTESMRLYAIEPYVTGDPQVLWDHIEPRKPYGRVTVWTRVCDFYQWCVDRGLVTGGNPYRVFRDENAMLFKNAYEKSRPEETYEEIYNRCLAIPDLAIRRHAILMLTGGMRYAESHTLTKDGWVVGKGSKRRRVYPMDIGGPAFSGTYSNFLRLLKKHVGVKPHTLRKLAATELVRTGAVDNFELQEAMGWASIQTATSYVQVSSEKLGNKIRDTLHRRSQPSEVEVPGSVPKVS